MSIEKKYRRPINVDNTQYVWYVSPDVDSPHNLLHIASEDKSVILSVPLDVEKEYIVSKGRLFQGKKTSGHWERYLLPMRIEKEVTPALVSSIIKWAANGDEAVAVEWDGKEFPV